MCTHRWVLHPPLGHSTLDSVRQVPGRGQCASPGTCGELAIELLDRDVRQVDVATHERVGLEVLDVRAPGKREFLVDERDDSALLADHLVDVTPGLLPLV